MTINLSFNIVCLIWNSYCFCFFLYLFKILACTLRSNVHCIKSFSITFHHISVFFFNFILGMSAITTTIQVAVINIYYRGEKEVPEWIKKGIIVPLCLMMFVKIPGNPSSTCCNEVFIC